MVRRPIALRSPEQGDFQCQVSEMVAIGFSWFSIGDQTMAVYASALR